MEIRQLKERLRRMDGYVEVLCVDSTRVDELVGESASLAMRAELDQARRDTLANRISELEVDAAMHDRE